MDFVLNKVDKQWGNYRNFDQNMVCLKRKLEGLNALKEDTESRMRLELRPSKKLKKEVPLWLGTVERINSEIQDLKKGVEKAPAILRGFHLEKVLTKIQEVEDLVQQGRFDQGLVVDDLTWIGQALATTTLVGKGAEICMKEVWACLMDDEIRKIGVWGMGGVGKTTIMKIINNQLLTETEKFNIVIWITVSKEMNIPKIQKAISHKIGETISEDEDEITRAGMLFEMLTRKGKYVLILDDLWHKLSLEEVGIPEPSNGSKLVVTTRMMNVCRYLGCREVRMSTLPKEDAWSLFSEKVGRDVSEYENLSPIVESVVEQCAGLPLAIVTVASSMKGITSVHEWRNALNELSKPVKGVTELDEKVFQQLQFSYNHLSNEKVQRCFLCCALYPEDWEIPHDELIELWIAEGLVEEMDSRRAEFDKGYTILTLLVDNCLLESGESYPGYHVKMHSTKKNHVKMHDLVRDMALRITSAGPRFLVEAGMQLKEIPHEREWTEDLEKVSLMHNGGRYEEISLHIAPQMSPPKCQMLTTLLLSHCFIMSIPDYFFEQMKGLKVLDLSRNYIKELPSSISKLEALTALLLTGCVYLKELPSFSKLQALKKLDLESTQIESFPHGMERLVNLNYLHLQVEEVPSGILSKFSCLQHLVVRNAFVKGGEIGELKKLEFFAGTFPDLNELNAYAHALHGRRQRPRRYHIGMKHHGQVEIYRAGLNFSSDLQQLNIADGIPDFPQDEVFFPWLISTPNCIFNFLKEVKISNCQKIKKLFSCSWMLKNIQNLEVLRIHYCDQMEEIIASEIEFMEEEIGDSNIDTIQLTLPKLRILELWCLRKLKSVYGANRVMVCDSLEMILTGYCPNLQRIPLYLPPLDDGQPSPPPSLKQIAVTSAQWELVEWDQPDAKSVLEPFVTRMH